MSVLMQQHPLVVKVVMSVHYGITSDLGRVMIVYAAEHINVKEKKVLYI